MIQQEVISMLSEQFGVDAADITDETDFEALGADSIDLVELSMNLEEKFDIEEMSEDAVAGIKTVGDLITYLRGVLGE